MENERKITAMGMAAGQARLLSITARMSDNELRAQIINNDKMRLATESSQVSDHYVQALNEAELMFANYDKDNNASFKQLTYNALTSFNPYNNQYALTNASGNILLSEDDARNYRSSETLEDFLKCYNLEQTTTFFDNLEVGDDGKVVFTNPYVDDDETTPLDEATHMSAGLTREQLEIAYIGNEEYKRIHKLSDDQKIDMNGPASIILNGYENTLNSEKYNEYFRYLEKYNQKWDDYLGSVAAIQEKVFERDILQANGGYNDLKSLLKAISDAQTDAEIVNIMKDIQKMIEEAMKPNPEYARDTTEVKNFYKDDSPTGVEVKDTSDLPAATSLWWILERNMASDQVNAEYVTPVPNGSVDTTTLEHKYTIGFLGPDNPIKLDYVFVYNEDGIGGGLREDANGATTKNANFEHIKYKTDEGNEDETSAQISVTAIQDPSDPHYGEYLVEETIPNANTLDDKKSVAKMVANALKGSIPKCWDPLSPKFRSEEPASTYYAEWDEAAQELGEIMYGSGYSGNPPKTELGDPYVLYRAMAETYTDRDRDPLKIEGPNGGAYVDGNGDPLYPDYGSGYPKFDDAFYQVYLNIILDKVQDTYGEPYFTWIDTTSEPTGTDSYNVNGEAKAQWYENIWNMCQKNGYKILKDGLASSSEWIQYAFESGIVNMQQVDENNNWNPLIYTNCSDITSQTSDKMIAKAEAEYSAAMKKIENKDKRYDLELKNIDTEHNSLQTEYESIKAAMDKHIDRVFKLYS